MRIYIKILAGLLFVFSLSELQSQNSLLIVFKDQKFGVTDTVLRDILPCEYSGVKILDDSYFTAKNTDKFAVFNSEGLRISGFLYDDVISAKYGFFITEIQSKFGLYFSGKKVLDNLYNKIEVLSENIIFLQNGAYFVLYFKDKKAFSKNYTSYNKLNYYLYLFESEEDKLLIDIGQEGKQYHINDFYFYDSVTSSEEITTFSPFYAYRTDNKLNFVQPAIKKHTIVDAEEVVSILEWKNNSSGMASLITTQESGIILVSKAGKIGALNSNFETILSCKYDKIMKFGSDLETVIGFKHGYYSVEGKVVLSSEFDSFTKQGDIFVVQNNSKYGVYVSGKKILDTEYEYISIEGSGFVFRKNGLSGFASSSGKIILPAQFNSIKVLSEGILISKNYLYGFASISGKIVIKPEYDNIFNVDNGIVFKKNNLYGIALFSGKIIHKAEFTAVESLSDNFFKIEKGKLSGVVDMNGKIVVPCSFCRLTTSLDPNIFKITTRKTERVLNPISGKMENLFREGYVNAYGQILLDTTHLAYEIYPDFAQGLIKVKSKDAGIEFISFDEKGKLIDKVVYQNYISVKEISTFDNNYWRSNYRGLWGLYTSSGRNLIENDYTRYTQGFLNKPELVLVEDNRAGYRVTTGIIGPDIRTLYGVVNERTAKILFPPSFWLVNTEDFKYSDFARCFSSKGVSLMDNNAKLQPGAYKFIGSFETGFARFNIKGTIIDELTKPAYRNYVYGIMNNRQKALYETDAKYFVEDGKWGVMDSTSKYLIEPKYQYIGKFQDSVFIAKLHNKWGVITLNQDTIISFIYDDISLFYTDSTSSEYSSLPYYKVKQRGRTGVIDKNGKITVPVEFTDIELIQTSDNIYFVTVIENRDVKYGFVDTLGRNIMKPTYKEVGKFCEDRAIVKKSRYRWNFVDTQGELISPIFFKEARNFNEGYAAVKIGSYWVFINKNGEQIMDKKFATLTDFNGGIAGFGEVEMKRHEKIVTYQGNRF